MKLRRILALLLALVMVLALCSCKKKDESSEEEEASLAGTYDITVWVPNEIVDLTKQQIDDFNANNTYGIKFNATIEAVGEGDAATTMITDVQAGADIFNFAQDQFARLVQANALSKLGKKAAETVANDNVAGAVSAVSIDGDIYAYPVTADNTYFMYYDTSVVPAADAASLDAVIADCEAAGKYLAFQVEDSGWYMASFFFGAGCSSTWSTDADGNWEVFDDFNSDKGLIAAKGMNKLMNSKSFLNASGASEFDSGAAVVVSGTWDSNTAKSILGDNFGVAPLPHYTVDGTDYPLVSFFGYKLMGVKTQTDPVRSAALHKLAQYLTSEEAQVARFQSNGWGPANKAAQASDAVKSDDILAAVFEQEKSSIVQGQVHDSWWNVTKSLGAGIKAAANEDDMKATLAEYDAAIEELKHLGNEVIFVGAWNGWDNADASVALTGDGDLSITLDVEQSDYMGGRIVKIGTWENDKGFAQVVSGAELLDADAAGGDNNIVFKEPGNYTVTINANNEITVVKN